MPDHRPLNTGDCCRIAAASVLLLSFSLAYLLLHEITLCCAAGILAAACSMLTCIPAAPPDRLSPKRTLLFQGLAALLPIPLASWAGKAFLPAFYTLTVSVPIAGIQTLSLLRMTADRNFLSSGLSGWECMLLLSKQSFSLYPVLLLSLSWSGYDLDGIPGRILPWCTLLGLSVLFLVELIRGITNQSLLSSRFEAGLIGQIGETDFLRPHPAARLSINHRMLFDKVSRHMDEKRPYLDDTFSLEDMSRALLTNKSYMSKVINSCTGMNFSQFVNNYRVRYSMELFRRDPRLKVSELALMSGFHSGVTFNLAFRLFLGQTPSEWCREYRERTEGAPAGKPAGPKVSPLKGSLPGVSAADP